MTRCLEVDVYKKRGTEQAICREQFQLEKYSNQKREYP